MDAGILLQLFESREHLRQRVSPGQLGKTLTHQRVQADIDARQTRLGKRAGQSGEEDAVGGKAETAKSGNLAEHTDEIREVATHRGLASSQANLLDADSHGNASQAGNLLVGQDLSPRHPGQAFGGHAVDAAEVAPVGNGDAQTLDAPTVAINQLTSAGRAFGLPGHGHYSLLADR